MHKITIDLADVLHQETRQHTATIPATVELGEMLEFLDVGDHELDLDNLLARDGQVALIWSGDDVLARRPDLNDEQAWAVLIRAKEDHERDHCQLDFIESTADGLYPRGDEAKERLRGRVADILKQIDSLPADELLSHATYGEVTAKLDQADKALSKLSASA